MPAPEDKKELQEFMGMLNFFGNYIPNLSDKSAPLREMLKKDSEFMWEAHHQRCFEKLKSYVTEEASLQYFDTRKVPIIHTDASLKGLGAALLQEHDGVLKPIAFASKALTPAESRYACIERELLAIVYAVERFHTYVYGRTIQVVTDHKPLVMIMKKGIAGAPPRLQRLLLRLQGYDIAIEHQAGKLNALADTLSRLPRKKNCQMIDLDLRVDFVRFTEKKVKDLQQETAQSPVLQELTRIIVNGWPERMKDLPSQHREYWSCRDELSVQDGIVMKGQRVLIPECMQEDILEQLHYGHMGAEKTKLRARDCVYWPGINNDIEKTVGRCTTCQTNQPSNQKEELMPHEIPSRPWQSCGTDMFHWNGDDYLILQITTQSFQS